MNALETPPPVAESRLCRLKGLVRGQRLAYLLAPGENFVGFLPGSTIVLPFPGVSRRHARLSWDGARLLLQDLGSKNGTFVNGSRVERGAAGPGDAIDFGPVRLEVEVLDPGDAQLALRIERLRREVGPAAGESETERVAPAGAGAGEATGVFAFVEALQRAMAGPRPSFHAALALLGERLGAAGAALAEWPPAGEPCVLATWGVPGASLVHPGISGFFQGLARDDRPGLVCRAERLPEGPGHHGCGLKRAGAEVLGCVLRAPAAAGEDVAAACRVFLRLVDPLRSSLPADAEPRPGLAAGTLAVPSGKVRCVSAGMKAVYDRIERVSRAEFPVLFLGETGTGKEHLVRLLHQASPRAPGPFVAVNCAAIPAELLEAEMFGIGRGVATGVQERRGRFQEAHGGTLFLDEIGDLPLPLQGKLLRALEEREVLPVGGQPLPLDVRVVLASNVDLRERVRSGAFRADLFHRVSGFVIEVPPLRRRREDIGPLLEHFLGRFAAEADTWVSGVTLRALELLTRYPWPGNVRELENEVRRLVYLCPDGQPIESVMLAEHVQRSGEEPSEDLPNDSLVLQPYVDGVERRLISEALRRTEGHQAEAARLLGLSRNGLALKMKRLGVRVVGGVG